jgi:hypothetical protein
MPNNDKPKQPRGLLGRLTSLRKQMNGVYRDTYSTEPRARTELDRISTDIEDNIGKILARNGTNDVANISKLYAVANLRNAISSEDYNKQIIDFFEDRAITDQLVNAYTENKWVVELDREIDVVCKYMPKLLEALDAVKDAVLTSDNFDKDFLSFTSPSIGPDDIPAFNEEIEQIKRKYKLDERVERWYDNTSKYGEQFVYKVPYNKALATLMGRRSKTVNRGLSSVRECSLLTEEGTLPAEFSNNEVLLESFNSMKSEIDTSKMGNIKLEICYDSVLTSAVNESTKLRNMISIAEQASVKEATMDKVLPDETFEVPAGRLTKRDGVTSDGLVAYENNDVDPKKLKVPGLLLKDLKRENVIILQMDDICLGYYYVEFVTREGGEMFTDTVFQRKNLSSIGYSAGAKIQDQTTQGSAIDNLLKYLAYAISSNLDDKFINNNTELRNEIYAVLKYNDILNSGVLDTIRVTYLAPGDVEHILFKEDLDTHRGISDITPGLIPAKLWCCLYICNLIGILTRGQDKRVYYVKQNVEQNIAQTLLNVINQIKKQNFNIMQIENMNSILGITGKYNDYVIPVGQSGDPPIQMEVMQGQEIDPQTDLLEKLEGYAIDHICPVELLNARMSIDYASQLTMTNTKFLRFVYKRQSKYEVFIGNIITDIYNTEFPQDNGGKTLIKCVLPSPTMLNATNLNQIIDLIQQQAQTLAELTYPDDQAEETNIKRAIFKKTYVQYKLGSYLKQNELDFVKDKTDLEYEKDYKKKPDDDNGGSKY